VGVIDSSEMGGHYLVAALLCGRINYPVLTEPCKGRGHERKTAQSCLPTLAKQLGPFAPDLWLFDALYFNCATFKTVRDLRAHLLIKYSSHDDRVDTKLFRDVLEDANRLLAIHSPALEPLEEKKGFDAHRQCTWSMKKNSAAWLITTDLSLDFAQAREPAHLRWLIENTQAFVASWRDQESLFQGSSLCFDCSVWLLLPSTLSSASCSRLPMG
jgi:hypothetical protein